MPTDKEIEAATRSFEELMTGIKTTKELVLGILESAEKEREKSRIDSDYDAFDKLMKEE